MFRGTIGLSQVGGRDVDKVRSAIEEGGVYSFSKFLVVNMKPSYKPFCAKYMIKLTPWTKMDRVEPVVESFPRFVFHLLPLFDLSLRVGNQAYFIDVMAMIVGVFDVTHIQVGSNLVDTPRRVIGLKDLSGVEMKLVLWGNRANEFDAEAVHLLGKETLSGGPACKWYLNEDIAETDELCESFLCTVTVVRISTAQPWWFLSYARCYKASAPYGSEYRCSGGCTSTTVVPKYCLCLICSDGTAAAEFVLFGRVAQQVVGQPIMSLMKSDGIPREIATIVSQKFTFAVSVS
uniref:Replication protein A OB domain-containing protein n=1 Tax=Setaria viridis TaxID=4556 RepID=A0A4U6W9G5_SETVI|nr:hypothetical protein SEVIR_1G150700v2 [Setaria viridis]